MTGNIASDDASVIKAYSLPHQLPHMSCGFGDICATSHPFPPALVFRLFSGGKMAGVCVFVASVCVCVKVVRHLLRSDEGIFEGGKKALSQLAGHED